MSKMSKWKKRQRKKIEKRYRKEFEARRLKSEIWADLFEEYHEQMTPIPSPSDPVSGWLKYYQPWRSVEEQVEA